MSIDILLSIATLLVFHMCSAIYARTSCMLALQLQGEHHACYAYLPYSSGRTSCVLCTLVLQLIAGRTTCMLCTLAIQLIAGRTSCMLCTLALQLQGDCNIVGEGQRRSRTSLIIDSLTINTWYCFFTKICT